MRLGRWWVGDDGSYLAVLTVFVVATRACEFLWPAAHVLTVPLATACMLVGAAATAASWLLFRPRARWDGRTYAFWALWFLTWALAWWASVRHGDAVDLAVVVAPIVIALVATKRPSGPAVTRAVDAMAWATAVLMLGTLLAQVTGILDRATAGTRIPWDIVYYWTPLNEHLGIVGRWIGPLRTPNVTASAAVLLIVWGASRGWTSRIVLMGTGGLVLLLTGTRSSAFAAIAGVVVLLLLQPTRHRMFRRVQWALGCTAAVVLVLGTMYWVERNPSLSGRMHIWPVYFDVWRTDMTGGVGDSGIGLVVEAGRLPGWATHAHSILIDPLVRDGAVVALAIVATLVLAVAITVRGARHGRPIGLALMAALLVGGLTETLFDWRYLGYQVTILLIAVLLSAAYHRGPGQARATQLGRRGPHDLPAASRRADACVAMDAAEAGARVVRSRFGSALTIDRKAGEDFATDVDVAAEREIREILRHERPDDAILGEELGGDAATDGRAWLIDPLCGTVNFASGVPLFATNVALVEDGRPVVAAVTDPVHGHTYWTDGSAAWRWTAPRSGDIPLEPDGTLGKVALDDSADAHRTRALLGRGFDPVTADDRERLRPLMVSTSLATVWVADGRLAAYVAETADPQSVHFAAGIAIATAAGCIVTDLDGAPVRPGARGVVIAADAATHVAIVDALRS